MAQKTTDCEHAISQENTVQGFSFVLLIIVRVANRTDDQKTVKTRATQPNACVAFPAKSTSLICWKSVQGIDKGAFKFGKTNLKLPSYFYALF